MALIIYNKLIAEHRMIYKTVFAFMSILSFKEATKKYQPYEDEQHNKLAITSLNAVVRFICLTNLIVNIACSSSNGSIFCI